MDSQDEKVVKATIGKNSAEKDWFLQNLVSLTNNKISFGVTLTVSGTLISGTLIGGKEYFKLFGESFASGMKDEKSAENVKATYAEYGKTYDKDSKDIPAPSFIHLKGAKFYAVGGEPIPSDQGVLWRGRISEVSGFSLGAFSAVINS